jgi:hypothetical protein
MFAFELTHNDADDDDNSPVWPTWAVGALPIQGCEKNSHQSRMLQRMRELRTP